MHMIVKGFLWGRKSNSHVGKIFLNIICSYYPKLQLKTVSFMTVTVLFLWMHMINAFWNSMPGKMCLS